MKIKAEIVALLLTGCLKFLKLRFTMYRLVLIVIVSGVFVDELSDQSDLK
jgi:hypothetical protein